MNSLLIAVLALLLCACNEEQLEYPQMASNSLASKEEEVQQSPIEVKIETTNMNIISGEESKDIEISENERNMERLSNQIAQKFLFENVDLSDALVHSGIIDLNENKNDKFLLSTGFSKDKEYDLEITADISFLNTSVYEEASELEVEVSFLTEDRLIRFEEVRVLFTKPVASTSVNILSARNFQNAILKINSIPGDILKLMLEGAIVFKVKDLVLTSIGKGVKLSELNRPFLNSTKVLLHSDVKYFSKTANTEILNLIKSSYPGVEVYNSRFLTKVGEFKSNYYVESALDLKNRNPSENFLSLLDMNALNFIWAGTKKKLDNSDILPVLVNSKEASTINTILASDINSTKKLKFVLTNLKKIKNTVSSVEFMAEYRDPDGFRKGRCSMSMSLIGSLEQVSASDVKLEEEGHSVKIDYLDGEQESVSLKLDGIDNTLVGYIEVKEKPILKIALKRNNKVDVISNTVVSRGSCNIYDDRNLPQLRNILKTIENPLVFDYEIYR